MSHQFRIMLVKLAIFFVVAALVTLSVIASLLDLKLGEDQTPYHAMFSNATVLQGGDVVRIAGVEVGKVNSVGLDGDVAKVDFTVDSDQHLTTNSTATIEFENLLGQRYLQINQGSPGGQPLKSGATIPVSRTTPGFDLTSVFSGFQPLLAALNPTQVNELTGSIVAVLQGESGAVANLVNQTAAVTTNLAQRQTVIDEILDNLTPALTQVNSSDSQLGQLISGLDTLVTGLAGERQQVGDAVTGLSKLSTATSNLLDNIQPTLDQDLGGLQSATAILLHNQGSLSPVLANLAGLLNALDKATGQGSYLTVYVCDLTISTNGPISVKLSSTVPQSPNLPVPAGVIGDQSYHTPVCS